MDPDEMISCLDEIAGLKDDCGKLEKFTDNFFDRWNFRNRKLASKLTKKCKKVEHKCNAASSSALAAHCRTETNERKARLSSEKAVSVPGIKGASTADLLGLASEQVSTPNSSSMTGQQPLSDSPKASEPLLALGPEPMRGPESTYVPVTGCASDARTTHDDAEDLILLYKNLLDEPSDRNLATPALTPTLLRRDSPDPMLIRLNSNSAHQASVSHGEGSPSLQGFVPALVGGREAGVASTQGEYKPG
ncbi:hypothetical protein BD626DRAFT_501889 [Schizophyllum amplum]|uniref:Uncharacterized protein n=1 Tax=Schizophyllum amplum TaxID=97359 RepID=A0A550C8X2_9AGAR|nr:hypothetical protein BD626DRAFT_501889 [Auriculariopsis ampla]